MVVSILGMTFAHAISTETAELFAPGVISGVGSNFAPAFSPDRSYVLFTRMHDGDHLSILIAHRVGSAWSAPHVTPFSGHWNDLEPALSVDGSYVLFASDRPVPGSVEPLQAHYQGSVFSGGNLWRSKIIEGIWTEPEWLPAFINNSASIWTPSVAGDGNLYFMSTDQKTDRFRLHVALQDHGNYQPPGDLSFSNGEFNDVDPMIDPHERFLIFSSDRAAPGPGSLPGPERLFIAFDPRGSSPVVCPISIPGWGELSLSQTEARLSPDQRMLFFASKRIIHKPRERSAGSWDDGKAKIWMVPLRPNLWQQAGGSEACRKRSI